MMKPSAMHFELVCGLRICLRPSDVPSARERHFKLKAQQALDEAPKYLISDKYLARFDICVDRFPASGNISAGSTLYSSHNSLLTQNLLQYSLRALVHIMSTLYMTTPSGKLSPKKSEESISDTEKKISSRSLVNSSLSNFEYLSINWAKVKADGLKPILAVVNRKSGGRKGEKAIENLQKVLSNIQICDLSSEEGPQEFFKYYQRGSAGCDLKILCCGGDGTIGWIMDEVYGAGLHEGRRIAYGIIPFGTGNDLFNHIKKLSDDKYKFKINFSANALVYNTRRVLGLFDASQSRLTKIDRWAVAISEFPRKSKLSAEQGIARDITPISPVKAEPFFNASAETVTLKAMPIGSARRFSPPPKQRGHNFPNIIKKTSMHPRSAKVRVMNNYLGVGVDGEMALLFSSLRRKLSFMFFHAFVNKVWYAIVGFIVFFSHAKVDLSKNLELRDNGKLLVLPKRTLGLIFSNIGSYAGGTALWTFNGDDWKQQRSDDGIIEVMAVKGALHLGLIKIGLSSAIPVAQSRSLQIITKKRLPMQIDGEPWNQRACSINISSREQVDVMVPSFPGDSSS